MSWISHEDLRNLFESHFHWLEEWKQELEGTHFGKIAIQQFKKYLDEMVDHWKRCLKNSEKIAEDDEVAQIAEQDHMDDNAGIVIEALDKMREKVVKRHQARESQQHARAS